MADVYTRRVDEDEFDSWANTQAKTAYYEAPAYGGIESVSDCYGYTKDDYEF
jgi:hypothetical protein